MPLVYGNPYSGIETIFKHQGYLDNVVPSVVVTDVMSLKNADRVQFYMTALNVDFNIDMNYCNSSGLLLHDNNGVLLPTIEIIVPTSSVLANGRQAYHYSHPVQTPPDVVSLPDYADFVVFTITFKANAPYLYPAPALTGVPNLHNSDFHIKDERAPLLHVECKLINPKP
jgi:hypothetical protein